MYPKMENLYKNNDGQWCVTLYSETMGKDFEHVLKDDELANVNELASELNAEKIRLEAQREEYEIQLNNVDTQIGEVDAKLNVFQAYLDEVSEPKFDEVPEEESSEETSDLEEPLDNEEVSEEPTEVEDAPEEDSQY